MLPPALWSFRSANHGVCYITYTPGTGTRGPQGEGSPLGLWLAAFSSSMCHSYRARLEGERIYRKSSCEFSGFFLLELERGQNQPQTRHTIDQARMMWNTVSQTTAKHREILAGRDNKRKHSSDRRTHLSVSEKQFSRRQKMKKRVVCFKGTAQPARTF